MKIKIVFDTSSLRDAGYLGASQEFDYLKALQDLGKIELSVSEITLKEAASQMREKSEKYLGKIKEISIHLSRDKIINDLILKNKGLAGIHGLCSLENDSKNDFNFSHIMDKIQDNYEEYLRERFGVLSLPITHGDTESVWRDYFCGSGNFSSSKNRSEIPDAYIYSCVKRMASVGGEIVFVCQDKNLGEAVERECGVLRIDRIGSLLLWLKDKGIATSDMSWWAMHAQQIKALFQSQSDNWMPILKDGIGQKILSSQCTHVMLRFPGETVGFSEVGIGGIFVKWDTFSLITPSVFSFSVTVDASVIIESKLISIDEYQKYDPWWKRYSEGEHRERYLESIRSRSARFEAECFVAFKNISCFGKMNESEFVLKNMNIGADRASVKTLERRFDDGFINSSEVLGFPTSQKSDAKMIDILNSTSPDQTPAQSSPAPARNTDTPPAGE